MKKLHSLIATLIAFSIILSMFTGVFNVTAATVTSEVWDGTAATEFAGGDGTASNPYQIENGAQLAKAVIDKGLKDGALAYYIITNDIYLNEDYANYKNWGTDAPDNNWGITYSSSAFAGCIDGGYHTIYGMYYSRGGSYAGLVAYLSGAGSKICNLTIANSYVNNSSANTSALFAGRIDNATISNCVARDSYITNNNNKTMAGIAAWSNTSTTVISNCGVYGLTFSSGATIVGGILAQSNGGNAKIANCFSIGVAPFGNTSNIDANNSWTWRTYTDVAQSKAGVVQLELSQMQGSDAFTNMPKLSTNVWKTTNSYPALIGNGTKGEVWSGTKAAWFAGGKGTAESPFLIETPEQLYKAIADKGMYAGVSAHYLITADLYLNSGYENYADWATTAPKNNWGTIYSTSSFAGYLDGGFHTIYGMYYNASGSYAGLVPYLSGSGATICNLTVTNSYVNNSGGDSSAIIAGRMDNGTISNCIAHDSYITNSSNSVMAGIVGYTGSGSVNSNLKNCGVYDLIFSADATYVGGMLGKGTWPTYLNGCYSGGVYILGKTDGTSCANSHTDTAGTGKNGVTNWSATPEKMQGEGAVANMALSTTIFKDTEGYPTFALNNGTKGEVWTGAKANSFVGGNGTEESPYLIETAEQLYKAICDLGKKSDGTAAYYLIISDIYVNENYENYADWANNAPANNWLPTAGDFIGHLDGGLNTVYGLYSVTGAWRNGLIGRINSGATVSNVIVTKAYVRNNDAVAGGIVGAMYDNTRVSRCMVYDAVISAKNTEAAGIVAKACKNTTTIENCASYNVTLSATSVMGGILGKADQATSGANGTRIYNCYSVGNYPLGNNDKIWANHNYSNISGTKSGIALVATADMQGSAAAGNMKYLDFINTWTTTENGYPVLRAESDNNLNQEITASYSVESGGNAWVIFTSKVAMPKINPTYDDNIVITIDGTKKTVSEVGIIISREGIDVTDISKVENNPLTGYKVVGYTNGADNSKVITAGGQVEINAVVNGTADYIAKSYIVFADETVVIGDAYAEEPSGDTIEITSGVEVSDVYENGDANFDGAVDLKDIVRFKKYAVLGADFAAGALLDIVDTDGDSAFAATDIVGLRGIILNAEKKNESELKLVFEDNFDTLSLDSSKWDFTDYMKGYGVETAETSDVQSIERDENGNGYLHLTAYKTEGGSYKSVKSISTGNKLTFVHGYLEIRAKVPTVQGAWPSLWLKSNTGNTNLGWSSNVPYNTEVDVFEVMGGNKAISELHKWQYDSTTGTTNDIRYSAKKSRNSYAITDNDWHTYGMLWTEDSIKMYVDDELIQTYDLNKDYEIKWPWDTGLGMDGFKNQPLCITLNNHLFTPEYAATTAGSWASGFVAGDDFTESVYDIDYVRLYQDETDVSAKLYKAN